MRELILYNDATTRDTCTINLETKLERDPSLTKEMVNWPHEKDKDGNDKKTYAKNKGMLDPDMFAPEQIADDNHRNKNTVKELFRMAGLSWKKYPITSYDAVRLKWYVNTAYAQNKNRPHPEFKTAMNTPLKHIINVHTDCGEWCCYKTGERILKLITRPSNQIRKDTD